MVTSVLCNAGAMYCITSEKESFTNAFSSCFQAFGVLVKPIITVSVLIKCPSKSFMTY